MIKKSVKISLLSVSILLLVVSCGLGNFKSFEASRKLGKVERKNKEDREDKTKTIAATKSIEETKLMKETANTANSYAKGLYVKVKNLLAQEQPQLSVKICSDDIGDNDQLCFVSENIIDYNDSKSFYIPMDDLKELLAISKDQKIRWSFNDTHSSSYTHWRCWEKDSMKIDNLDTLTTINIEVTQINNTSYSCRIN